MDNDTKMFGEDTYINLTPISEPFLKQKALYGYLKNYRINGHAQYDLVTFLNAAKPKVITLLNEQNKPIKVKFICSCAVFKVVMMKETRITHLQTLPDIITAATDLSEWFNTIIVNLNTRLEEYEKKGSGYRFDKVVFLDILIDPYKPLSAKSYIPLPKELALKKAIINVKNENDNECFKWAVTSAVYQVNKNAEILSKKMRQDSEKFDWTGIEFPVTLKNIKTFEKNNPYAVNVYGYEGGQIYPLRISKRGTHSPSDPFEEESKGSQGIATPLTLNLLLISNNETNHYCWIKNMSRLLSSQINKHKGSRFFCYSCLNSFPTDISLKKHEEYCLRHDNVAIKMPEPGTFLKFINFNRKMKVPFVIYADFECFTENISSCRPDPSKSFTENYQKHTPSGYCYLIKCFDEEIFKPKLVHYTCQNSDEDIPQMFVDSLERDIREIYKKFKFPLKLKMSSDEETAYESAKTCHICEKEITQKKITHFGKLVHYHCKQQSPFGKPKEELKGEAKSSLEKCFICNGSFDNVKVKDYCSLTGKFRGAAHNICQIKYKVPKFFPVIIHNLSGYDAHLFIKNLGVTDGKINCIPSNEEKYISFTKQIVVDTFEGKKQGAKGCAATFKVTRELRFIDSFKFMDSGLDKLVNNLRESLGEPGFKNLSQGMDKLGTKGECDLLLRKGVFPYDWFDGFERLTCTSLPPKEMFYSRLNDTSITDEDYTHAKNIWRKFDMKNMRDYHDLYLKSDVLLLADVFENFRSVCLLNYKLDPAWYYTAPGLSWDAALKLTGVQLELLNDYEKLLMIESGIRGGVSMISTRYGVANNKYMKNYDADKSSKFITYLDANNLYGWAMSQPLPTHGFRWMTDSELEEWTKHPCILEVDLEYPQNLHDLHNEYPLAPESLLISNVNKLIPNLKDKEKYVLHYKSLKKYLDLGLKLKKIHRGITFKESAWLKSYISLNTDLRAAATNEFEKGFFKLMNNSVFGKTMENIRKRVDIRLVTNEFAAKKLISKPNYAHRTIFCENLVAIHMKKTSLFFNKPVYLGMSILDISKILMYDFHYNYIKTKYNSRAKLLFTDTDSLAYEIETEDFYKDISQDVHQMFDTSNYDADHPSGIETGVNKKVIGMFKDEACGKNITEFVGLRAKLYSYKIEEEDNKSIVVKKCKGVKQGVVKRGINFDDYLCCLLKQYPQMRQMNVIGSIKHEIYTRTVNKVALSHEDDKRIIKEDGIHTYALGHYREREQDSL